MSLVWDFLHSLFRILSTLLLGVLLLSRSTLLPGDQTERVRAFTRSLEFNYVNWVLDAWRVKFTQGALQTENYLPPESRRQLVVDYLQLVADIQRKEHELSEVYADPHIRDPFNASLSLRNRLADLYNQRGLLGPVAEAVLQDQISTVVARMGLALGGQPIPAVLYHTSHMPWALIVSPRSEIRQDEDISLVPEITLDQQVALENQVEQALNVSSLVVGIGGIGVYPTMVEQTSNLNWLSEVVAHEWVHNFLTLRPLGINYLTSPELRTMNETVASIAGVEIGRAVLGAYYPELLPPEPQPSPDTSTGATPSQPAEPAPFNFYKEMRITRVAVDQMLADGKIAEAEAYMEQRRVFIWENGYHIRKLNQAYFAFHGAYADHPEGGAAGADPVGAAVRALRAHSPTLAAFLNQISWMSSFDQLKLAVQEASNR